MAAAKSTRLSIVEQAVADILERLADMKPEEASSTVKLRERQEHIFSIAPMALHECGLSNECLDELTV